MNRVIAAVMLAAAVTPAAAGLRAAAQGSPDALFAAQAAKVSEAIPNVTADPFQLAAECRDELVRIMNSHHRASRKLREFRNIKVAYYDSMDGFVLRATRYSLSPKELHQLNHDLLAGEGYSHLDYRYDLAEDYGNGILFAYDRFTLKGNIPQKVADQVLEAQRWVAENRESVLAYAGSRDRKRFWRTPSQVVRALELIFKRDGASALPGGLVFKMPDGAFRVLLTPEQTDQALETAYGARIYERLPARIAGFDKEPLFLLMKEMMGSDGLETFAYRARSNWYYDGERPAGPAYYSLPALEAWVAQHRTELHRILAARWIPMPVHPAMIWAVQETAVRRRVPVEDVMVATPGHLYIDPAMYPYLMDIFRANKSALIGDTIAAALDQLRGQIAGELHGIKLALEDVDGRLRGANARLGALTGEAGSIRRGIWTLDFLALLALIK